MNLYRVHKDFLIYHYHTHFILVMHHFERVGIFGESTSRETLEIREFRNLLFDMGLFYVPLLGTREAFYLG